MTGFHLSLSLLTPGHFRHAWRLPHADPLAHLDVDHFTRLAEAAEDARIDAVFLGDGPALGADVEHAPGTGLDPLVLLPICPGPQSTSVSSSPVPRRTTSLTTWRAASTRWTT